MVKADEEWRSFFKGPVGFRRHLDERAPLMIVVISTKNAIKAFRSNVCSVTFNVGNSQALQGRTRKSRRHSTQEVHHIYSESLH